MNRNMDPGTGEAVRPRPRSTYLRRQRALGWKVFATFPAQVPREIFRAMGVLPVEVWDPPLEIATAGAHLQAYICSVARLGLELVLEGGCDDVDGFVFPHTCDSIQNLASVVHDLVGSDKPCYFFYHPKAPYGPASRPYYAQALRGLVRRLEGQLGPLDEERLGDAVAQGRRVAAVLRSLYDRRARGQLSASAASFYGVVRRGEYLQPDDFEAQISEFLQSARLEVPAGDKPTVVLSGVLPNPPELLTLLDDLGVAVGHDDLLSCGRRLLPPRGDATDPFEALVDSYFGLPPCSTKNAPLDERAAHLLGLVESSGAGGVIFNIVKFCETEWFDVPVLTDALKRRGVPSLVLETELNAGLSGQLVTRVEAFVELLDRRPR